MVLIYKWQRLPKKITAWVDGDHAGCSRTRRSTSGWVLMLGQHCIRTWSSTQSVVALSSGESEWYAMLKGASVAMGLRSMVAEMGVGMEVELRTDSRAAKGIAHRVGLGKVKHLAVCYLWLQDAVKRKEVDVVKVGTAWNWADVGTKHF